MRREEGISQKSHGRHILVPRHQKINMFSYLILQWPAVGLLAALLRGASVKNQEREITIFLVWDV